MKLPTCWHEVRSADGLLLYFQRNCGGYRVMPLYTGRWHACERLTDDGWLEWAGREGAIPAMAVCGAHAAQCISNNTSAEGAKESLLCGVEVG